MDKMYDNIVKKKRKKETKKRPVRQYDIERRNLPHIYHPEKK